MSPMSKGGGGSFFLADGESENGLLLYYLSIPISSHDKAERERETCCAAYNRLFHLLLPPLRLTRRKKGEGKGRKEFRTCGLFSSSKEEILGIRHSDLA